MWKYFNIIMNDTKGLTTKLLTTKVAMLSSSKCSVALEIKLNCSVRFFVHTWD